MSDHKTTLLVDGVFGWEGQIAQQNNTTYYRGAITISIIENITFAHDKSQMSYTDAYRQAIGELGIKCIENLKKIIGEQDKKLLEEALRNPSNPPGWLRLTIVKQWDW